MPTKEDGLPAEDTARPSSIAELERQAEAGDGAVANMLGDHYRDGDIVSRDLNLAFRWYNRAKSPQSITDVLVKAASKPPDDYSRQMGWVLIAPQNAFWQLLHAVNLEEGIVNTVMSGGDTDTNAAIAGSLLGAVQGRGAIPIQWMDRVLSCRPISGMSGVKRPRPEAFWPVDALLLAERLVWLGQEQQPD